MRAEISRRFRALLSGSPTGIPEWTPAVEAGDDFGLYLPTDAPWVVHADLATMIGGIRALLLQAMHPGSLAGVVQHSRYEEDVLGRLSGTIRWLTIATFASKSAVQDESARVRAMHDRVRGSFVENSGAERRYTAADPDLLRWVHLAFTDSFLAAHLRFGRAPIPGGATAYVGEWAKAVEPLGLANPPRSLAELKEQIAGYAGELRFDDRTRRVVAFIQRPPLPGAAKYVYRLLFAAAVTTLPADTRRQLELKRPSRLVVPLTRGFLFGLRLVLGAESPLESAALQRHARLVGTQRVNA